LLITIIGASLSKQTTERETEISSICQRQGHLHRRIYIS